MITELTDMELADDPEAQLKLITEAYRRDGDPYDIDQVLSQVCWVRRMKRRGMYEWINAVSEDDEPE